MTSFEISRRSVVPVIAAGLASLKNVDSLAETAPSDVNVLKSYLAEEVMSELSNQPSVLAHVATKEFWERYNKKPASKDSSKHAAQPEPPGTPISLEKMKANMMDEGKMSIPGVRKIAELQSRCSKKLQDHLNKTPEGGYGLFVDGEYSHVKPKKEQVMYLIRKHNGKPEYVMSFAVSASYEEWSNKPGSKGTPLGTFPVLRKVKGLYGQIVSNIVDHKDDFVPRQVLKNGTAATKYFPHSIHSGDKYAAITSSVLWIDEARNIGVHGSNKIGGLGYPASDGCIRVSNLAMVYISHFMKEGFPVTIHGTVLSDTERMISDKLGKMEYK